MKDYSEQIERIENHLLSHPKDIQSKIQLMITKSNQISNQYENAMINELKEISKIRISRRKRMTDEQECK